MTEANTTYRADSINQKMAPTIARLTSITVPNSQYRHNLTIPTTDSSDYHQVGGAFTGTYEAQPERKIIRLTEEEIRNFSLPQLHQTPIADILEDASLALSGHMIAKYEARHSDVEPETVRAEARTPELKALLDKVAIPEHQAVLSLILGDNRKWAALTRKSHNLTPKAATDLANLAIRSLGLIRQRTIAAIGASGGSYSEQNILLRNMECLHEIEKLMERSNPHFEKSLALAREERIRTQEGLFTASLNNLTMNPLDEATIDKSNDLLNVMRGHAADCTDELHTLSKEAVIPLRNQQKDLLAEKIALTFNLLGVDSKDNKLRNSLANLLEEHSHLNRIPDTEEFRQAKKEIAEIRGAAWLGE